MADGKFILGADGKFRVRSSGAFDTCEECCVPCRTEGLFEICQYLSPICSRRFALCVEDVTYPVLDTDPAVILSRVTAFFYRYEHAEVKKFEITFGVVGGSVANFVFKAYTWDFRPPSGPGGTPGTVLEWVLRRESGVPPMSGLSFGQMPNSDGYNEHDNEDGGGRLDYRLWALDDWGFDEITATAAGVNYCASEDGFPCEIVHVAGVQRAARPVALDLSGTVTLTNSTPPANWGGSANKCVFYALHGTVTLAIYPDEGSCGSLINEISEMTLDVLWRVSFSSAAPGTTTYDVSLHVYSEDATDSFTPPLFEGSLSVTEDYIPCEGAEVDVDNTLDCLSELQIDRCWAAGGTVTVTIPARGN